MRAVRDSNNTIGQENLKFSNVDGQDAVTVIMPDNSMCPRILRGDVLTIKRCKSAPYGSCVLIQYLGGWLIRRLMVRFEDVVFMADAKGVPPIIVPVYDATDYILGRVVKPLRTYEEDPVCQ